MFSLKYAKDTGLSIASDGMTRTREKLVEAAGFEELIQGNLIPQYGSSHPENSRFRLTDASVEQIGNADGKCQFLITSTYSTQTGSSSGTGDEESADIDPWELDARDFTKGRFTLSVPVNYLRRKDGTLFPFFNSAHCRMQAQRDVYGAEYSFMFCLKYKKSGSPNLPDQPVVNSSAVRIAGEDLPAYSSLLYPPEMQLVNDYEDDGTLKRTYWQISCRIQKHPLKDGWFDDYPDIGTLALDEFGKPAPIYRFSAWTNKDMSSNLNTPPSFGTIQSVIAAKNAYGRLFGDPESEADKEKYWQAWQELPYEEMTEPLPLDNGKIFVAALSDPVNTPYRMINGTVFRLGKFQQYNIPEKREGIR